MTDGPEPASAVVFGLASGFRVTQALYVVVRLGIPERLASGPLDASTLAAEVNVNADRLHRVLRALASIGVFSMDPEQRFGLTPVSELLRPKVPGSLEAFVQFQGEEPYRAFGELLQAVRTGETPFETVYGLHHFDYLEKHPEAGAVFHRAMSLTSQAYDDPFAGYDLSRHSVLVDVGGGNGALIAAALASQPGLRGVLFDLPNAVAEAPAHLKAAGVLDRCEVRTGSAFDSVPPGGDVYVMSRILHDWPDERAIALLSNCRQAIPSQGVLLLREGILPEAEAPPAPSSMRDLMMLVMNGGRERTEREWRELLEKGGFMLTRVIRPPNGQTLLEARPRPHPK